MSDAQESPMLFGEEHVRRYQETDGEEGHIWLRGTTVLLLTTTGRKSGKPRVSPLIYREIDGTYVVVASKGGSDAHPDWYLNLEANPTVQLQVASQHLTATARTATAAEKPDLWRAMAEVWPDYDNYRKKTDREIPVVVLTPDQS